MTHRYTVSPFQSPPAPQPILGFSVFHFSIVAQDLQQLLSKSTTVNPSCMSYLGNLRPFFSTYSDSHLLLLLFFPIRFFLRPILICWSFCLVCLQEMEKLLNQPSSGSSFKDVLTEGFSGGL